MHRIAVKACLLVCFLSPRLGTSTDWEGGQGGGGGVHAGFGIVCGMIHIHDIEMKYCLTGYLQTGHHLVVYPN